MKVTVDNIKKFEKGALRGFFDLEMEGLLRINGCSCLCKGSSWWISFPSKTYQDEDGKTKYQPIIEMPAERLQSLRDLVMPELKAAFEAPENRENSSYMRQGMARGKPASKPADSGWQVPNDGLDDMLGTQALPDDDIPF